MSGEAGSGYVGRLAPSPTGLLHLGHAHTFAVAAERARAAGGVLHLRMDDLDRDRSREEYAAAIVDDLEWLGLAWQGPVVRQSVRGHLYRAALERLIASGVAFACTCSRRDLLEAVGAPHEAGAHDAGDDEPVYSGHCRHRAGEPFREGVNYRLRVPGGETVSFDDSCAGPQSFLAGRDFGDFLLWRKDGTPSYQLATVVDDAAMGVTEVVRGQDLLKSTARQILVARALGLASPAWHHTLLLRDAHGVRLAKRHDALSVRTLRHQGRMPAEVLAEACLPGRGALTAGRTHAAPSSMLNQNA